MRCLYIQHCPTLAVPMLEKTRTSALYCPRRARAYSPSPSDTLEILRPRKPVHILPSIRTVTQTGPAAKPPRAAAPNPPSRLPAPPACQKIRVRARPRTRAAAHPHHHLRDALGEPRTRRMSRIWWPSSLSLSSVPKLGLPPEGAYACPKGCRLTPAQGSSIYEQPDGVCERTGGVAPSPRPRRG